MPGPIITAERGRVEGTRRFNGAKVKLSAERAAFDGTKHIQWELTACKAIARVLNHYYPGHAWAVEVMADQGIAKISIPPITGFLWGYILHLDDGLSPKDIMKAGGEILERWQIPRSTINMAAYFDALGKFELIGNYRAQSRKLIPA